MMFLGVKRSLVYYKLYNIIILYNYYIPLCDFVNFLNVTKSQSQSSKIILKYRWQRMVVGKFFVPLGLEFKKLDFYGN